MQATSEAVFHERDGVVTSEIFMTFVVQLMRFLIHALGLAGPAEIQCQVIAELGMELAVKADLHHVGEVVRSL